MDANHISNDDTLDKKQSPYRLLGITSNQVGPFGLLGVSPKSCDRHIILHALRSQLSRLDSHPKSNSREAIGLRAELHAAADLLLDAKTREKLRKVYYESLANHTRNSSTAHISAQSQDNSIPNNIATPDYSNDHSTQRRTRTQSKTPTIRPIKPPILNPPHEASQINAPYSHVLPSDVPNVSNADSTANIPGSDSFVDYIPGIIAASGGWNARTKTQLLSLGCLHQMNVSETFQVITKWFNVEATPCISIYDSMEPASHTGLVLNTNSDASQHDEHTSYKSESKTLIAAAITFIVSLAITIPIIIWMLSSLNPKPTDTHNVIQTIPSDLVSDSDRIIANTPFDITSPTDIATKNAQNKQSPLPQTFSSALNELVSAFRAEDDLPEHLIVRLQDILDLARNSWTNYDQDSLQEIQYAIVSIWYEKSANHNHAEQLAEALLQTTISSPSDTNTTKGQLSSRLWTGAMIAILLNEPGLSHVAIQTLQDVSQHSYNSPALPPGADFSTAAKLVLRDELNTLIQNLHSYYKCVETTDTTSESDSSDWSVWCSAVNAVTYSDIDSERLLCYGIYKLVTAGPDLEQSQYAQRALGTIIYQIDWPHSEEGRKQLLTWYSDPYISAPDLRMITAFIVADGRIPGLDDTFILTDSSNAQDRLKARNQLSNAWQTGTQSGTETGDAELVDWFAYVTRILSEDISGNHTAAMQQLVTTSLLNEAGTLLDIAAYQQAAQVMDNLSPVPIHNIRGTSSSNQNTPAASNNKVQTAARHGSDGAWAAELFYLTQVNDRDGRLQHVQNLHLSNNDKLGPLNAQVLVDLATHGSPRQVREAALDVIVTSFANDERTLLILADSLPLLRHDIRLADMITDITNIPLPDIRSHQWYQMARLALLKHILKLRSTQSSPRTLTLDSLSILLAQSYSRRSLSINRINNHTTLIDDPFLSALSNYNKWQQVAHVVVPVITIPAPLSTINHRAHIRYTTQYDPIGQFAALQLATLDTIAYVTAAERPASANELQIILDSVTDRRSQASDIFQQLIETERGITQVITIRLNKGASYATNSADRISNSDQNIEMGAGFTAAPTQPDQSNNNAPLDNTVVILNPENSELTTSKALQSLDPAYPEDYFLLAEEADDDGNTGLARHLYVLAATIAPHQLGRSACLALADFAAQQEQYIERDRLKSISAMYPNRRAEVSLDINVEQQRLAFQTAATQISAMFGYYRRGEGERALSVIEFGSAAAHNLTNTGSKLPSTSQIISYCNAHPKCQTCKGEQVVKCPACRGGTDPGVCRQCDGKHYIICPEHKTHTPRLTDQQIHDMIQFEIALLGGPDVSWSKRLLLDNGAPKPILDPKHLPSSMGIDATKVWYYNGMWNANPES